MNTFEFWILGKDEMYLSDDGYTTDKISTDTVMMFRSKESALNYIDWARSRDWGWSGLYAGYEPIHVRVTYEVISD